MCRPIVNSILLSHNSCHYSTRSSTIIGLRTLATLTATLMLLFNRLLTASATHNLTKSMFKTVCLGGTFDGIHSGHKLLFGEATRLCNERLIVGVTEGNMIRSKVLWELIAPVEERIQDVRSCLMELNPKLNYDVVPISDLYGPTLCERDIDCIVVSEETVKGASKINEARKEKGWNELKVHVVNLLQDTDPSDKSIMQRLKENKVSSSLLRVQKLGKIIKPPLPNPTIPSKPYLIGLTGGVASGKTSIAKYLTENHGFGCINYDLLGHKTYEKIGSPVYKQIVEYFGYEVVDEATGKIDRSKLGRIVFSDKRKLEKLNEIVWPGIYALVDEEIERMKAQYDVIVLESALLIESNQYKRVHQVWTTIVPPDEAVKRQMQSRGLSEEEARKRVMAQTDNLTRVKQSNAIFSTLWEPEFTQEQVRKCVNELKEKYLSN